MPNAQIGDVWSKEEVDERIDESVLRRFVHIERMGNDRIAKRVYIGSRFVGRPCKRWTDSVNDCLKKKRFGCQASRENGPG